MGLEMIVKASLLSEARIAYGTKVGRLIRMEAGMLPQGIGSAKRFRTYAAREWALARVRAFVILVLVARKKTLFALSALVRARICMAAHMIAQLAGRRIRAAAN